MEKNRGRSGVLGKIREMSYRPGPMFLLAGLLVTACGDSAMAGVPISCADTELSGRIVEGSSTALPAGTVNSAGLWTLRVQVVRLLKGRVPDRFITVTVVSGLGIPTDVGIDFQLKRIGPSRYEWKQSERDCRK